MRNVLGCWHVSVSWHRWVVGRSVRHLHTHANLQVPVVQEFQMERVIDVLASNGVDAAHQTITEISTVLAEKRFRKAPWERRQTLFGVAYHK